MSSRARSGSGIKQPHVHERVDKKASAAFHLTPSASSAALLDPGGKTDHRFRQFLYDFSTLGASLEIVRSYLASLLRITAPQYNIAMILANGRGAGIGVSEVARRLHVSTTFITAEATNLESRGLIEKRRNPEDGRGVLLHLTPVGWEMVEHIGPERQLINDNLFGSLSARDFQHLAGTLGSLLDDFNYTVRLIKSVSAGVSFHTVIPRKNTKSPKEKR